MRVVVVGAGAQGSLFGGLLAGAGLDVTLVGRGSHIEAMQQNGLTLRSRDGVETRVHPEAVCDVAAAPEADLLLLAVKTYDLESALDSIVPLLTDGTAIMTIQNGVDAPDRVAARYGDDRVVAAVSYFAAAVEEPGLVAHGGVPGGLLMGGLNAQGRYLASRMANAFGRAGVETEVASDIRASLWEKLVLVSATGGVMALLRLPWGRVLEFDEGRALARGVMEETERVGRAGGVRMAEGTATKVFAFAELGIAESTRGSLLLDLVAGRRLELEAVSGTVVRLGRELGIPTPMNLAVYAGLLPYRDGAP